MFEWLRKRVPFMGSVLFRGTIPPRADDFAYLTAEGMSLTREAPAADAHWLLSVHHPEWGTAKLTCPRKVGAPPRTLVDHCVGLTAEEKELVWQGECSVQVMLAGTRDHVLRDRKYALRFLHALMGQDGLIAWDYLAQRFWSRDALEEELSHDADLDIQQIYAIHAVHEKDSEETVWLHSHGLGEIGFFDFDVIRPSAYLLSSAGEDGLRAIAFAIVEGRVDTSTPAFELASPGGVVRFVKSSHFDRCASREEAALRERDAYHQTNRAVLCEPAGRLLGRWTRCVRASRFLSRPIADGTVFHFSYEATELMAQRARATCCVLRRLADELAEFELPALVKLGYQVDGGAEGEREHLWFRVHAFSDDAVEATLVNKPCAIARFREGDRGRHPLELLTDWVILTPFGSISPRYMGPIRKIRLHRDELRRLLARRASH